MGTKDFKTEMMETAGDVIGMEDPHYRYNLRDIRKCAEKRLAEDKVPCMLNVRLHPPIYSGIF